MKYTKETNSAIEACATTAEICRDCSIECEGKSGMEHCARLCNDCATVCEQHADNLRNGDHSLAADCIAECESCAMECGMHRDMEACARCADSCRDCATACRQAEKVGV